MHLAAAFLPETAADHGWIVIVRGVEKIRADLRDHLDLRNLSHNVTTVRQILQPLL